MCRHEGSFFVLLAKILTQISPPIQAHFRDRLVFFNNVVEALISMPQVFTEYSYKSIPKPLA